LFIFDFVNVTVFAQPQSAANSATPETKPETKKDDPKPAGAGNPRLILSPEKANPVKIPKLAAAPVIDGKLDDAIWKDAAVFKDFIQTGPGDNIDPSKPTEVYMGYDEKHLYIAFKCWDEKDKIRATVAKRDQVFGEDNVRVWLDTYNDQRRAYVLGFNPLGIQQDGIFTEGQGADFNVDIVMESKGSIEEWGWAVEVKIPFKSLRYVAGKGKNWGFNAARNIDRLNDEFDTWMPDDRNKPGFLIKHGKISGLDEIKSERTLEIIPTLTLKQTGTRTSLTTFENPKIKPDFGFTLKYTITPNVTLDAAYNPDFADTEADAPVVEANQRFPIFFEEKRPFFLEGVEIFRTPIQAVYTRRIENPDVALKLTGKIGKNSFGIFGAVDDPLFNPIEKKAFAGVVRIKRDIDKENHLGFLATTYSYPEKHNTLAGFDGKWKINSNSQFSGQALASTSRNFFYDPNRDDFRYRNGNAVSYTYEYNYDERLFGWGWGGNGTTRDFRADLGFTQRTDTNQVFAYMNRRSESKPKEAIIQKNFNASVGFRNDFRGRFQSWGADSNVFLSLKGNAGFNVGGYVGAEEIYEDEFGPRRNALQAGQFFGAPSRRLNQAGVFTFFFKNFNKRFALNASAGMDFNTFDFDFGAGRKFPRVSPSFLQSGGNPAAPQDPGAGTQYNMNVGAQFKPTDKFSFSVGFNKNTLVRNDTDITAFDSNIISVRSTYQFSRAVFIRSRTDYNTLSGRLFGQYTFGWSPSPGRAFFAGYNDNWLYKGYFGSERQDNFLQLNRTFFVKFSYLFRKSF
jgi:hypothetical protein